MTYTFSIFEKNDAPNPNDVIELSYRPYWIFTGLRSSRLVLKTNDAHYHVENPDLIEEIYTNYRLHPNFMCPYVASLNTSKNKDYRYGIMINIRHIDKCIVEYDNTTYISDCGSKYTPNNMCSYYRYDKGFKFVCSALDHGHEEFIIEFNRKKEEIKTTGKTRSIVQIPEEEIRQIREAIEKGKQSDISKNVTQTYLKNEFRNKSREEQDAILHYLLQNYNSS